MLIPVFSLVTAVLTGLTCFLQIQSQHTLKAFDLKKPHKPTGAKSFFGATLHIPFPRHFPSPPSVDESSSSTAPSEITSTTAEKITTSIDESPPELALVPSVPSDITKTSSSSTKIGDESDLGHRWLSSLLVNLLVLVAGMSAQPAFAAWQKHSAARRERWLESRISEAEADVFKSLDAADFKRAALVAQTTLALITKYKGIESDDAASFAHLLAKCELGLGDVDKASRLLLRVLHHYEALSESEPVYLARALEDFARVQYEQWRKRPDNIDIKARSVELSVVFSTLQRSLELFESDLLISLGNQILEPNLSPVQSAHLEAKYKKQLALSYERKVRTEFQFVVQNSSQHVARENHPARSRTAAASSSSSRSLSKTPPKSRPSVDESEPGDENQHPNSGKSSRSKSENQADDDPLPAIPTTIQMNSLAEEDSSVPPPSQSQYSYDQSADLLLLSSDASRVLELMASVLRDNLQLKEADMCAKLSCESVIKSNAYLDSKIPIV